MESLQGQEQYAEKSAALNTPLKTAARRLTAEIPNLRIQIPNNHQIPGSKLPK
jgi:hypothetical protein